ncbi:MAG: 50S ribosomal protein L29 [Candidatus Odinarchaeum yellowstonii]|uniref:Large ribosomal subunit protein uL29 n=1 Tax=Odinarchaeota yellowstonii (strain LCB_4) TaxID=1841599 RepID=A0AAF0D3L1_ODILC|nr:MAG: 50S ribosomal protein L29 [Candidatus Odinarchaeum yellowstonii]
MNQIRNMSDEELDKKIGELYAELSQQRVLIAGGGAVENPSRIRLLRRTIAKLLTVKNERSRKTEAK